MSIKTPLNNVRGLGSAKEGVTHFISQRVTAVALVPLILWFLWSVVGLIGSDHGSVLAFFKTPFNAILTILMLGTGFFHLKLGLEVVIEDYVHGRAMKYMSILLNRFFCWLIGLATVFAVLKISLGA